MLSDTSDPEEEPGYTPDIYKFSPERNPLKLNCCDIGFLRFLQPRTKYFYAAKRIQIYIDLLADIIDPVISFFDWPVLPAGQHTQAANLNYLIHKIWMMTFAASKINFDVLGEEKEQFYKEYFEDLVMHAESVGVELQNFLLALDTMISFYKRFEDMDDIVDIPPPENVFKAQAFKEKRENFMDDVSFEAGRYTADEYEKLHIFTRDSKSMNWLEFATLRYDQQMDRISNGIVDLIDQMKEVHETLPRICKIIDDADSHVRRVVKITPHLRQFQANLETLMKDVKKYRRADDRMIKQVFIDAKNSIARIIQKSFKMLTSICEVIIATRICYTYLQAGPVGNGAMVAYEEMTKHWETSNAAAARKRLKPELTYTYEEFYNTDFVDPLRKVPVVVGKNAEMALHHADHAPAHKKNLKPRLSIMYRKKKEPPKKDEDKTDEELIAEGKVPNSILKQTFGGTIRVHKDTPKHSL